jgi:carbon monoxide dehydrogenase subunit G
MSATFDGSATITPDPATRIGLIDGKGDDRRGKSRGAVKDTNAVSDRGSGATVVSVDADLILTGPAAQFGRGDLITELTNRLITVFVHCCEGKRAATMLEERQEIKAAEVKPLRLFPSGLPACLKKLFGGRS